MDLPTEIIDCIVESVYRLQDVASLLLVNSWFYDIVRASKMYQIFSRATRWRHIHHEIRQITSLTLPYESRYVSGERLGYLVKMIFRGDSVTAYITNNVRNILYCLRIGDEYAYVIADNHLGKRTNVLLVKVHGTRIEELYTFVFDKMLNHSGNFSVE